MKQILLCLLVLSFCCLQFSVKAQEEEFDQIFTIVEDMPVFPGCDSLPTRSQKQVCTEKNLLKYLYKTIKYPEVARKNAIEGLVVAQFVITKTGAVDDIKILRGIGGGCDEETIRVIESMNKMEEKWIPGRQRGRNVAVRYNLPIRFRLSDKYKKKAAKEIRIPQTKEAVPPPPPPSDSSIKELKVVETLPVFPGCGDIEDSIEQVRCTEIALLKYCYKNIRYPAIARENGIEGIVVVQFVITKEGTVEDPVILRGIGGGCDEEVIRIVNMMNDMPEKWIPGTQNDEPVNVRYNLPLRFKLAKNTEKPKKKKRGKRRRY